MLSQSDNLQRKNIDGERSGMISIIVPTLNRVAMLCELLDCLAAQTWRPLEIIIVDDGSTDDTKDRIAAMMPIGDNIELRYFWQTNQGPAAARNTGLRQAQGEYVYLIDSDDLIAPDALAYLADALSKSDKPYCLANIRNSDEHGNPSGSTLEGLSRCEPVSVISSHWMTHAALYRRDALRNVGPFNERLRVGEDSELQWRVVARYGQGLMLPRTIGVRRLHGFGQLSDQHDPDSKGLAGLAAIAAFTNWAKSNGVISRPMGKGIKRYCLMSGIRLGAQARWDAKNQAFAIVATLPDQNISTRVIALSGRPSFRLYFLTLLLALAVLKSCFQSVQIIRHRMARSIAPKNDHVKSADITASHNVHVY